ncbi:ATP-dependent nuclease [Lactococcus lactis]
MKISRVTIQNYRNLREISIPLSGITTIIGNNNSGKSNFLRALTLPLLSEDFGSTGKNLSWTDLNDAAKNEFYGYISDNRKKLKNNEIELSEFSEVVPFVGVKIDWKVPEEEEFAMKEFITRTTEEQKIEYSLSYQFKCKNFQELLNQISKVLNSIDDNENIDKYKQNLLPVDLFSYSIFVPEKHQKVSYDKLNAFKYNAIVAERDEFSSNNSRLGSKSLVQLLNNKLRIEDLTKIESNYFEFFEEIKSLSNMDNILNWQETSVVENAKDFFSKISILPNMPPMTSLLNSVQLGYDELGLSSQGLGYRNLILQLVLINSLIEASKSLLSVLTIEEPEAHLCYRNEQIMMSYFSDIKKTDKNIQLLYSTHNTKFIDKFDLGNIVLINEGKAFPFCEIFDDDELGYLAKSPNLDLFKLFYSKKCILVEGISEELLIKSFLQNTNSILLNDVEVISFHKGFKKIIDLWLKINKESSNRLGIIRDFDNQANAQEQHEKYNEYENIFVETTTGYTLEDDIVSREGNFSILQDYFKTYHGWENIDTPDKLSKTWKSAKAEIMYRFCLNFSSDILSDIKLPKHIEKVLIDIGAIAS